MQISWPDVVSTNRFEGRQAGNLVPSRGKAKFLKMFSKIVLCRQCKKDLLGSESGGKYRESESILKARKVLLTSIGVNSFSFSRKKRI